jgi:hypothetical protein
MEGGYLSIGLIVVAQLALPGYFIYDVSRGRRETVTAWWLRTAAAAAYLAFVFVTGRWDLVGYPLRYVVPVLFAVAAPIGYARVRQASRDVDGGVGRPRRVVGSVVSLLLFTALAAYALRGLWYDGEPVHLSSPVHGGAFYVGQGGDSPLLNYHNQHASQRFALDVLQLNAIGTRAASLRPTRLEQYVIFGHPVRSPCHGRVVASVDRVVDNVPPRSDPDHPAGNHVVLACQGVRVFLAHLRRGSVTVQPGDSVASGHVIGRVGNSGNSSEPHLHVHAEREGTGGGAREGTPVPILFDGTFPVRNTILRDVEGTAAAGEIGQHLATAGWGVEATEGESGS